MQNVESIPIEVFVVQVMATKVAMQIVENWPLKSEAILAILVKHFNDLGIYQVNPFGQADVVKEEILFFLKNSPQILEMIAKAKKAAKVASQRGRANDDV
ncbi:MAG: hypothetical protein NT027_05445 [Proteobacteria bacterium]|nr:hypothetical protein [Pseudomonadota bacterium]